MTGFDFDAAVQAPFRMQPGLRRLAPGSTQLTPLLPGSRHQREKLAVLSAYPAQALCAVAGFDARAALAALCTHAAKEQPAAWQWDGSTARALQAGVAVTTDSGAVQPLASGVFGLGDELPRCLLGLAPGQRLAGLLCLAFAEDVALVDAASGRVPWLAVCLPSSWAPQDQVGRRFDEIHVPVADNARLLKATEPLLKLVSSGPDSWERFVWTVTDNPRLHAHPAHSPSRRFADGRVDDIWLRSERQTFLPLPALQQAWFTIHIDVQPLADATRAPGRAQALHAAIASMSPAVLHYRGLDAVRAPLLSWLQARARADSSAA